MNKHVHNFPYIYIKNHLDKGTHNHAQTSHINTHILFPRRLIYVGIPLLKCTRTQAQIYISLIKLYHTYCVLSHTWVHIHERPVHKNFEKVKFNSLKENQVWESY